MAQNNKANGTPNTRSAEEMREWYEKNKDHLEKYAEASDAVKKLRDVTKTTTKTVTAFSKETLRTYLQNIGSNEVNLRNLSRYLYYRSQVYYRLIKYNSNMFVMNARSVIPQYSMTEENNKEEIMKSYYDTVEALDKLNLQYEVLKIATVCFREDVFYGCAYYDGTSMFILPLDPDYCKLEGVYQTGDFSFSMNMSYFNGTRAELLDYWGEPFQSMYKDYQSTNNRWQAMPDEYCACFKVRADDWETVCPPFSGMFNSLINLLDLEDIQAVADEQQIYRLVWLKMDTISGSKEPDDWEVDPDIMIEYYNRMVNEALPEYTTAAIVPGDLDVISFGDDQATDTTKIEDATKTVLNTSGGAQILNSSTISGTTAFNAATKSDTEYAISMLLPQIQAWVNRFLSYYVTNPSKVKFFEVSTYTVDSLKDSMLQGAQYGLPTKLTYNTLNGFSELDTLALNFLEEDCLDITNKFVPLKSSYTTSSSDNEAGGQTKDDDEITDDGEASRDKRDRSQG